MTVTLYRISIPVFQRMLGNLQACLDKGEVEVAARQADPATLLDARLAPDMFPLTRQVQLASDFAKGAGARLAGVENPKFADSETSFAELRDRIARTQAFLKGLTPAQVNGGEDREVTLSIAQQPTTMAATEFLTYYAFPHFFFHVTTAYDILRAQGVALGKPDFMGSFAGVGRVQ